MPITGRKREELTINTVLQRCTDLEIISHFMPNKNWQLNSPTNSIFREDKNPSMVISNKNGYISYIDWGNSQFKGDAFNFVKQLYNLPSLDAVLRLIDKELNLGITYGRNIQSKPISQGNYKQEVNNKRNILIQVVTRTFTSEELAYWNAYHIDISDLRDNSIYSIKTLYLNKKKFPIKDEELRFGYFYPNHGWKLYFPNREKRKKWLSNIPLNLSYGLENLSKDKNTIVTKALKDYLIVRKIYPNVCHVQNESLAAFSKENIDYLNNNSKQVYCNFDSDESGKKASWEVTTKYNWKHINVPDNLFPIKDLSDWAKSKGLNPIKDYLKSKGLIT